MTFTEKGEQQYQWVKSRVDYYLTLDMTKELAMVERNEKGKQARQYFIECERRLKAEQATRPDPMAAAARPIGLLR